MKNIQVEELILEKLFKNNASHFEVVLIETLQALILKSLIKKLYIKRKTIII